jgi:hypothetical protein
LIFCYCCCCCSGGGGRKEAYVVDYCYEQNEKNDLVFEREVKPFINEVFDGRNATIIACGARGTGKSYLFQVLFLIFFIIIINFLFIC